MAWFKNQFLKVIEWKDFRKDLLIFRYPMENREIMKNSKLTVREGQEAIFVHKGQIADLFKPGLHNLTTENTPVLTSLASWKYWFESPIKAEVYFVNTKQFTDQKWGTVTPIIVRDKEFGVVRLRGYGKYSFRVSDSILFLKEIFATNSSYQTSDISEYLKSILVSSITDIIAEAKIPLLDISANTLEFNQTIKEKTNEKFEKLGLHLQDLFIENISVPEEVEKMLDTRSSMGIMSDKMDDFMKYQATMAMRDAAKNEGGGVAGAGVGLGAGMTMGSMFMSAMNQKPQEPISTYSEPKEPCAHCGEMVKASVNFCPNCGKETGVQKVCPKCGKPNSQKSKFCSICGENLDEIICPKCSQKLPLGSKFCFNCGEKL